MNATALELDRKLQSLDPDTAASLEQIVREALQLAEKRVSNGSSWPPGFWRQIRADWGTERFERPA